MIDDHFLSSLLVGVVSVWWGVGALVGAIERLRDAAKRDVNMLAGILYLVITVGIISVKNYLSYIKGISSPIIETLYSAYIFILWVGIISVPINFAVRWIFRGQLSKKVSQPSSSMSSPPVKQEPIPDVSRISPSLRKEEPAVSQKTGVIFISYRRSDSADVAGRIYDRLVARFGREQIFKDVDSIPLGRDFKVYLDGKVGECSVLLAVIGDQWMDTKDSNGKRRLDDPLDFVRIEIESALDRDIPVVPLLVRGAYMPREDRLPPGLQKLVYRNGIPIRPDPDFHRDMDRLISALDRMLS